MKLNWSYSNLKTKKMGYAFDVVYVVWVPAEQPTKPVLVQPRVAESQSLIELDCGMMWWSLGLTLECIHRLEV